MTKGEFMPQLDAKSLELINKTCKDKKHIKLTVGLLSGNERTIKTFGENGEIDNKNFTYEIGSITKTFTASLLAKHVHKGSMSLDDSIAKYVDGLDPSRYYPTLRRLATHTAGYSSTLPFTRREYFALIIGLIRASESPGTLPFKLDFEKMRDLLETNKLKDKDYNWRYSNFGMALLGYAIGVASGAGYHASMGDFLTTELGLSHTFTSANPGRLITGYTRKNVDCGNWIWGDDLTAPAGDISSTADDLLTYAAINMHELRPYLAMCHQKNADVNSMLFKSSNMGLGWLIRKDNSNIIWHNGGTGAFSSYLGIDKNRKCAVVVLANYRIDPNSIGETIFKGQINKVNTKEKI